MPTALLAGAFGQRNPGDEALLTAFVDALPGWTTIAPADNPAAVTDRRVRAIPATARHTAAALLDADALVFAGGTVFKTLPPATGRPRHALLARGAALARSARALGRPVALVGVGAGALPDPIARTLAHRLAVSADMLVLRDGGSAATLARAGVPEPLRVGADAVWALFERPQQQPRPATGGPLVVTLSRHADDGRGTAALAGGIAELLRVRPDLDDVVLEPWQVGGPGRDDLELARELQRALRVATGRECPVVAPPESVTAASRGYRQAALVLGQRFHSLVAAAAAGTPFVAVAHETKSADLAARLGQRALAPDHAVADVAPTLAAALDGPAPSADVVAELVDGAHTMLALMRAVVDGGRHGCPQDLRGLRLVPEAVIR